MSQTSTTYRPYSSRDFDLAFAWILEVEGAQTDDPLDPGGLTRFGIAQNYNPDVDVAGLTVEKAKAIYRQRYWDAAKCGAFPYPLNFALFDAAVNQGVRSAVRQMQLALRVHPDGIVGPDTLDAASRAIPYELLDEFQSYRAVQYADGNPRYRRGWFRRQFKLHRRLA